MQQHVCLCVCMRLCAAPDAQVVGYTTSSAMPEYLSLIPLHVDM